LIDRLISIQAPRLLRSSSAVTVRQLIGK